MNAETGAIGHEDAEQIAELFARWAASEGILLRFTAVQFADLANAFTAGFAFGAAVFAQNRKEATDAR